MSRDHTKLRVFHLADTLVLDIYRVTKDLPPEERYGLQAQIRRAAVSAASNIVEGCARRTTKDYLHFCNISAGSACEMRYLLSVADRLGFLPERAYRELEPRCTRLAKGLVRLIEELELEEFMRKERRREAEGQKPRPKAQSRKPKAGSAASFHETISRPSTRG